MADARQRGDDAPDRIDKPHVQHAIGLVEHQHLDGLQRRVPLGHQIEETARRRDDDVDVASERVHLGPLANAAEHSDARDIEVTAVGAKAVRDLDGELARRCQHESARAAAARTTWRARQTIEDGQRERGRLTGPGLRAAEHVAPGSEKWNGLRLDGRGRRITGGGHRAL